MTDHWAERDMLTRYWTERVAEKDAEIERLRAALQQIAGPWDDRVMKQARTLHYDMAGWAQRALAAAQEPPTEEES